MTGQLALPGMPTPAFDPLDALNDLECRRCETDGPTIRITGGSLHGAHLSTYACDLCAPSRRAIILTEYEDRDIETVPLPCARR